MTQIGFPRSEAHAALDEFLADGVGRWVGTTEWQGSQEKGYGDTLVHIVGDEAWQRMQNGYHQWMEAQEVRDEELDPPSGYTPWKHSPLAATDRLLPVEPLLDVLSRMMFQKRYAELPEDGDDHRVTQWHVRATAIMCLLEVQLDPDGQGAVPIMALGHDADEPGKGLRWQIAFRTSVRGLYLRASAGFFGDEWAIVTGSGYKLAQGWYERDQAEAAVSALGRVLPNTDWMRLTPSGFTPRAQEAIKAVMKRYHTFGLNEGSPEPDVMDDVVPVAEEPAEAVHP